MKSEMATSGGTDRRKELLVHGSDEDYDLVCLPCHNDGLTIPAMGFCIDCNEHLCNNCYIHHRKATLSKHHRVQGRDAMPSKQILDESTLQAVPTDNLTTPCPRHQTEMIKLYCHNHSLLICSICVALDHHKPCIVEYIPDISNTKINSPDFQDTIDDMDKLLTTCTATKTDKSNESLKKALRDIKKYRQETNKRLDRLQKEVENKINALLHRDDVKRKRVDTTCEDVINKVKVTYDSMKQMNTSKQANGLFIALIHARTQLDDLGILISSLSAEESIEEYMFIPNQALKDVLQNEQMIGDIRKKGTPMTDPPFQPKYLSTSAGDISAPTQSRPLTTQADDKTTPTQSRPLTTEADDKTTPTQSIPLTTSSDDKTTPTQSRPLTTQVDDKTTPTQSRSLTTASDYKTTPTQSTSLTTLCNDNTPPTPSSSLTSSFKAATLSPGEICVKTSEDRGKCLIRGMTVLPPDRLVLADSENNSIKLLNVKTKSIIAQLSLGKNLAYKPRDITTTTSTQVAVTVPNRQHIQFIAVTDKLSKAHTIQTDGKCSGICFHQDKLIVTYCKPGKLEILDMNGTVITKVTTDSTGKDVFEWPVYVQANSKCIYASDEGHEKVTMLNWQGKVTGRFRDLKLPRGLALLSDGTLIACDRGRDTVCKVASDCEDSTTVLQNVRYQLALCVDDKGQTMYISRCSPSGKQIDNSILVYKIQS